MTKGTFDKIKAGLQDASQTQEKLIVLRLRNIKGSMLTMTESIKKQVRAVLPLLKAPMSLVPGGIVIHLGAQYGSPTTITVNCRTDALDLRDGDLLTLYTEVMLKPHRGEG